MQKFVVGFCFSKDHSYVAIMKKNRPAEQAGLHNGLGGKVEPGEKPADAMSREFEEETGVYIWSKNWKHVGIKTDSETYFIDVYYARNDSVFNCRTQEDEEVILALVDEIDKYEFFDDAKEIIKELHEKNA